ncbi:MAG: DUF188 domain-containing protein [Spirochaetia bacterium]
MTIWVDADGCPARIRRIIEDGAVRTGFPAVFVADRALPIYEKAGKMVTVEGGADAADNYILANVSSGDLVITRDIPLADGVVSKGCTALDDRGNFLTVENVRERLSIRNFLRDLRESGVSPKGTGPMTGKQISAFAASFDSFLTSRLK